MASLPCTLHQFQTSMIFCWSDLVGPEHTHTHERANVRTQCPYENIGKVFTTHLDATHLKKESESVKKCICIQHFIRSIFFSLSQSCFGFLHSYSNTLCMQYTYACEQQQKKREKEREREIFVCAPLVIVHQNIYTIHDGIQIENAFRLWADIWKYLPNKRWFSGGIETYNLTEWFKNHWYQYDENDWSNWTGCRAMPFHSLSFHIGKVLGF